jgi:hypothetical protein
MSDYVLETFPIFVINYVCTCNAVLIALVILCFVLNAMLLLQFINLQEMGLLEVKHGLLQIAESLDFLHNHAHLIHRAIAPEVTTFFISFRPLIHFDLVNFSPLVIFLDKNFFFWKIIIPVKVSTIVVRDGIKHVNRVFEFGDFFLCEQHL